MKPITYQESGVDPVKAGEILKSFAGFLKSRPKDPNLIAGIGPFASCYSLKNLTQGLEDPVLVTCCDGVGTKLKLALDWKALGHLGHDLVGMNVNDLLCAGARPLLFLDYYACGALDEAQLSELLRSIQRACEESQCTLAGGETAEMPGLYAKGDFDLAGFSVGIADRSDLLGPAKVQAGDRILALASTGFHSNGYSLVRKVVEREKIEPTAKPSFGGGKTWRELLLAPTRLYVSAIVPKLSRIHALAHLTGGGLFENLPRVLPSGHRAVIDGKKWAIPPLFTWFQEKAGLSTEQLLSTFNCGAGMLLICAPKESSPLLSELNGAGISTTEVGAIELHPESKEPSVLWQ